MSLREACFAVLLAVAVTLVTLGVAMIHEPAAYIVAGALAAGWAYLVLADTA